MQSGDQQLISAMLVSMQKWEYKVFSSHLDPAELGVILDSSGREGWELVTLVAVANQPPFEVIKPVTTTKAPKRNRPAEVVPMQTFRYLFKRPFTKRR
jgi:hypothetical protein